MKAERIDWVDILKGIGIIFVVIGHVYSNNVIFNWIYSFHMPLFFFAAGVVYKKKTLAEDLKNRLKKIVIPYFTFGLLEIIYWQLIEKNFREINISLPQAFMGLFSGMYDNLQFNVHLWFLTCFFCTVLIFNVFVNLFDFKITYLICIVMSIFTIIFSIPSLIWGVDLVFKYILFYSLGVFFSQKHFEKIIYLINRWIDFILIVILLVISFILVDNGLTAGVMRYICAIIGIFSMVLISMCIGHNKILSYLGNISLVVLCIHGPIYRIIIKLLSVVLSADTYIIRGNFAYAMIVVFLTILICGLIYQIINRIFPWMIGKKKNS